MRLSDTPIVSVIIPSAGKRPQLLRRAIDSAIAGWHVNEVEVVVVFNGNTKDLIPEFEDRPNIRCFNQLKASVCEARNYGLQASKGILVRFLDDDDFLIPAVAVKQCRELWASSAEISSFAIAIQDEEGRLHGELRQPVTLDFVAGQLSERRVQIPLAHVYRKTAINNIKWNSQYTVSEDTVWLHSLAVKRDFPWIKSDEVVGVWYQHRAPRLSYAHAAHEPHRITAESILDVVNQLQINHRLTEERQLAAAAGLWACVHQGFYLKPFYWHKMAKIALRMKRHTDDRGEHLSKFLFHPIAIEWLMLPKRVMNHLVRRLLALRNGWNYVRRL